MAHLGHFLFGGAEPGSQQTTLKVDRAPVVVSGLCYPVALDSMAPYLLNYCYIDIIV